MASRIRIRRIRKFFGVEDLLRPELRVPDHVPPSNSQSTTIELDSGATPVNEVQSSSVLREAEDHLSSSTGIIASSEIGNQARSTLPTSHHTRDGFSSGNDQSQQSPSQAPLLNQTQNTTEDHLETCTETVSPAIIRNYIDENTIVIPTNSPHIYCLDKNLYIGKLKELPPPPMSEEKWINEIREQLVVDLRPILKSLPHSTSRQSATVEPMLCMTGEGQKDSSSVQLRPTIWIRCGSEKCKVAVQRAITDLSYIHAFSHGRVHIDLRAPRFATNFRSVYEREGRLTFPPATGRLKIFLPDWGRSQISAHSACGIQLKYISGRNDSVERRWVIGGVIRVDGTIYGLTTAHPMFDELYCNDESYVSRSYEDEPRASVRLPISNDMPRARDSSGKLSSEGSSQVNFTWKSAALGPINYAGTTGTNAFAKSGRKDTASDFALIPLSHTTPRLHNYYRNSITLDGKEKPQNFLIDDMSSDLSPGEVTIICSPTDAQPGYLLGGSALFMESTSVFRTRKVQTESPLKVGVSGTWVVRGSNLLGIIIAVYEDEPYAHMLPIGDIFSDIRLLLEKEGRMPQIDLDIRSSARKPLLKSQTDQESQHIKIPNFPALEPITYNQRHGTRETWLIMFALWLTNFSIGMDITAFPTIMPIITNRFNSLAHIGWYGITYFLALCVVYPIITRLFPYFSMKRLYLGSLLVFEGGCLLCAFAPTSAGVITGRAISGLGAGGCYRSTAYLLFSIIPERRRQVFIWLVSQAHGVGRLVGPLIGGAFAERLTYKWAFFINTCFGGCVIAIILVFLNPTPASQREARSSTFRQIFLDLFLALVGVAFTSSPVFRRDTYSKITVRKVRGLVGKFDILGLILLVGLSVCLSLGLYLGVIGVWRDSRVIVLFTLCGSLSLGFAFEQSLVGSKAILPYRKFEFRIWSVAFLSSMWGAAFYVWNHFFPTWLQTVRGEKPFQSGVLYLPTLGGLFLIPFTSLLFLSWNSVRSYIKHNAEFLLLASLAWMALASGLSSTFSTETVLSRLVVFQIMFGLGAGIGVSQAMLGIQLRLQGRERPSVQETFRRGDLVIATDIMLLTESFGAVLGISAAQTVFISQLKLRGSLELLLGGATSFLKTISGESLGIAVGSFNQALTRTFFTSAAAFILSFALFPILAFLMFITRCLSFRRRDGKKPDKKWSMKSRAARAYEHLRLHPIKDLYGRVSIMDMISDKPFRSSERKARHVRSRPILPVVDPPRYEMSGAIPSTDLHSRDYTVSSGPTLLSQTDIDEITPASP